MTSGRNGRPESARLGVLMLTIAVAFGAWLAFDYHRMREAGPTPAAAAAAATEPAGNGVKAPLIVTSQERQPDPATAADWRFTCTINNSTIYTDAPENDCGTATATPIIRPAPRAASSAAPRPTASEKREQALTLSAHEDRHTELCHFNALDQERIQAALREQPAAQTRAALTRDLKELQDHAFSLRC